ncbi:MAG: hypothetical protein FJ278_25140, partial [Planctomycetes bacterium]|nr:hypothetical protein [Planctomycetota bacterium]
RVVDWGSLAITAASTTGVAVEMSALSFEPDKPIEATVAISDHNPKSQYEVAAQIRDGDGRILARQEAPVPGGALSARVSLRLPRPNGLVYYLEASLIEAIQNLRRPIAYDLAKFTVPNLPRDEYYVSANDSRQMTHLSWLRTKMSQRHGVDCKRGYGFHILGEVGTAYQGQSPAPFFSHVGGCGFLGVPARCLSAPEYRQQLMDGMKHLAEQVKPYGASCYNLGDDTGVCEALCKQPGCFERFVEAMRKKYGSVGSLNKVWGTKLRRLEDVTVDFIGSEQVAQNYGPWFDYLYWHEDLYCETFKRCNDIVRAVDPNAWVGQDASGYANVIDLYLEGCTYVAPYFRRVLAKK